MANAWESTLHPNFAGGSASAEKVKEALVEFVVFAGPVIVGAGGAAAVAPAARKTATTKAAHTVA